MTATSDPATVLIVDDEPSILASLQAALACQGYRIRCASNGQEALDGHASEPCDLAIIDLGMPVMSGWDVFEGLSRRDPLLPVIILTARRQQLRVARAARVAALLEKPVEMETLFEVIEQLLDEPAERRLARLAGAKGPIHRSEHR